MIVGSAVANPTLGRLMIIPCPSNRLEAALGNGSLWAAQHTRQMQLDIVQIETGTWALRSEPPYAALPLSLLFSPSCSSYCLRTPCSCSEPVVQDVTLGTSCCEYQEKPSKLHAV